MLAKIFELTIAVFLMTGAIFFIVKVLSVFIVI